MSYRLETLNRGVVDDCGFLFGNESIKLGALPSMPIEQFVKYSAEIVLQIIESEELDPVLRKKLIARTAFECGRLFQSRLDRKLKTDPEEESVAEMVKAVSPSMAANFAPIERDYPNNPFKFKDGKVIISNFYETAPEDFVLFASYIFGGGTFGHNWTYYAPPEEVKTIVLNLQDRLEGREA